MKIQRIIWITVLLVCLTLAAKLAFKPVDRAIGSVPRNGATNPTSRIIDTEPARVHSDDAELLERYPDSRELVTRALTAFGHNARRIELRDGLAGLRLLDQMGDAGVCLSEERPEEFRRLCRLAGSDADASKIVGAWRQFFDPNRNGSDVTARLAAELSKLNRRARQLAEQTPEALPFLLTDSRRVSELMNRVGPELLESLVYVDLSDGGESLRNALAVVDRHGKLALDVTSRLGPPGLLVMERFGPLVELLEPDLGLDRALAVVVSAISDLQQLLGRYRPATIAAAILHLDQQGLLDQAAMVPDGLKLVMDYGRDGEAVLSGAGAHAVDVIYRKYDDGRVRNAIVRAIAQTGPAAAVAAEKHAESPDFRRIVDRDGSAAVLAVAQACSSEEARRFLAAKADRTWTEAFALTALRLAGDSGDCAIRMIDRDGLERAAALANSETKVYQFLPLYDLSHLGGVVAHGFTPTRGEFVWAGVDAALVTFDALSLMTLQPEGVAASEAARSGIKSTARAGVQSGARSAVEHATETAATRAAATASREVARGAGGQLAERGVAASSTAAAEAAGAELTATLARRSGIRLAQFQSATAARALVSQLFALPRNRLGKYVAANAVQAGVGVVAVRKMEEYLEGRGAGPGPDANTAARVAE